MYELRIQREFCAAHSIVMQGVQEPVHGHNWRVTVSIIGPELDDDGLLCDFHYVEKKLDAILKPLHNANLNDSELMEGINPSAELVAKAIAVQLSRSLPDGVQLKSVGLTEAPGCEALYFSQG